ncbi:condensation domain-containing protein, partial [Pseudonocardia sp. GCM10023141]|uniref:condensation domain-containing protein n=1 Tax=Pseudonocardia sp. GCM10023141 TaxID=3252653 RepID=UPI003606C17C
ARAAGLALSPRDVFEHKTIAGLARALEGRPAVPERAAEPSRELIAVAPDDLDRWRRRHPGLAEVWPLSPLQHGFSFNAAFQAGRDGDGDVYVAQTMLDIDGALDAERMRAAATRLVERHPVLRTAFVEGADGMPVQLVVDGVTPEFTVVDTTPAATAPVDGEATTAAERRRPFDLTAPPHVRFLLLRTGPERHRLVLTNHHIVLDGWSIPLLVRDLLDLYAEPDRYQGEHAAPPASYREYLRWLAEQDVDAARAAWRRQLSTVEEPTLLVPGTPEESTIPVGVEIELDDTRSAAVVGLARERGVTVNTVVQAAWAVLLGGLTGRAAVTFGTIVAGRPPSLPGVEDMVGLFINSVPVHVVLGRAEPVGDLLTRVQEEQSALLAHQHLGLADIAREVAAGGGPSELFDTLVVVESYPLDEAAVGAAETAAGLRLADVEGNDATHYPVVLVVRPGERLGLEIKYRPDLLSADDARLLLARVDGVLATMTARPELPVGRVEILTPAERASVVTAWNDTDLEVAAETLPELVAHWVRESPDAPAVVDGATRLTYRELDARAAGLAARLAGAGFGPEQVVGVHLERSADLVVALLAVEKAGAAFVPVEPSWPAARIAQVCASAGVVAVVSADPAAVPDVPVFAVAGDAAPGWVDVAVDPEGLAYVMFTSGSTGVPKGA